MCGSAVTHLISCTEHIIKEVYKFVENFHPLPLCIEISSFECKKFSGIPSEAINIASLIHFNPFNIWGIYPTHYHVLQIFNWGKVKPNNLIKVMLEIWLRDEWLRNEQLLNYLELDEIIKLVFNLRTPYMSAHWFIVKTKITNWTNGNKCFSLWVGSKMETTV